MTTTTKWNERSAYLMVQTDRPAGERIWKKAQGWKETIGTWMVTGPWDMIIWIDAQSWKDVYSKVVSLRNEKGVKVTSTHFVYKGNKNGKWWWEWPVGSWVFVRTSRLNGGMKSLSKWNWVSSVASIPGDWDYLVWAGGRTWDDVWKHIWNMNTAGCHTQTLVPLKSWWNKAWKGKWWN